MSTWTADALELWEDLWSEFGTTASYGAFTFRCIKDPVKSQFQMTPYAYDKTALSIIDLLRTDAVTCGLYALVQSDPQQKRPVVTINNERYECQQLENDDSQQPSIRIRVSRLQ